MKQTYANQDLRGKARILQILLDRVIMKGEEANFVWLPPFGTLFNMGELVIRNNRWGE